MKSNNRRIAKNTVFLYVRMLMVMLVTIYTARVVLDTLGIEDYGIYSLVGGVVVMFTFLNGSMTACTQRYLCVAIGKGDAAYERDVFHSSIVAHLLISVLFVIIAETLGLWFVSSVLKIPEGSEGVTLTVYQISIVSSVLGILRIPYNAAIVANERMSFFAYSGIIETLLKLLILFPLVWIDADKLVLYTILVCLTNVVVLAWYYIYVVRHFSNCRLRMERVKSHIFGEMLKFTGWSNFSSISNLGAKQGMGFIMNHFFGVFINAAIGVMNQVTSAVYGFITNFQTAVNPPLVKLYVAKEWRELESLFVMATKVSFYLMLVLSVPIIVNINPVLHMWLKDVPGYATYFCALSLVSLLPNVIGGPIWTIIQASGNISRYQMIISCFILLNLPLDYLLLRLGVEPYVLLWVTFAINFIVVLIGVKFISISTPISWRHFRVKILFPCFVATFVAFALCAGLDLLIGDRITGLMSLLLTLLADALIVAVAIYICGLTRQERSGIVSFLRKKG